MLLQTTMQIPTEICVCQLNCSQLKLCYIVRTRQGVPVAHTIHFTLIQATLMTSNAALLTNLNSISNFKETDGCVLFFFFFQDSLREHGHPQGSSRAKFIFSFHAQREVNSIFLAYCDCQENSLFPMLCREA